jgi:thioredoxin-like negative regulator of GroEL
MRITEEVGATAGPSAADALTESEASFVQADLLLRIGALPEAERALKETVALDAGLIEARIGLAELMLKRDDPEGALAALDTLRLEPGPSALRLHLARGGAALECGQFELASQAYDAAARANAQSTAAWFGRSVAALAAGNAAEAARSFDRLQQIEKAQTWYPSRAYEAFRYGAFDAAASDARTFLDRAGRANESSPYMTFLGAACLRRLGRGTEADALLAAIRPELEPASWQAKLADFMQGQLPGDQLIASAESVEERTEARTYVALSLLQQGRRDDALVHLRWVRDRGAAHFVEHGMAKAELRRLESPDGMK